MTNTPHFNAIIEQFLTEGKKSHSAKQAKKGKPCKTEKPASKKMRAKGK
jgi:hypothetical protein